MMNGLDPGPTLFVQNKMFVWTVIGSMYIGNALLLLFNLPLVGIWARISLLPYKILAPIILSVCLVGAYSPRNTMFDVWIALCFGVLGFFMRKRKWPLAPLILGFVLGDMFERALRQSLALSGGNPIIFLKRPISAILIICTLISLVLLVRVVKRVPKELMTEGESE
jgi:putative tricarboxylic transport membrane protein